MGKRFHSYKKNKLVRSKVKTHKQRLHYEAIIQVAQIQDEDLLYLNFTNAAAGMSRCRVCVLWCVQLAQSDISAKTSAIS